MATVRRLEGRVLHPRRDAQGIYWFSVEEVERLRCIPEELRHDARSAWLKTKVRLRRQDRRGSPAAPRAHARVEDDAIAHVFRAAEHVLHAAVPLHHVSKACASILLAALEELAAALDAV